MGTSRRRTAFPEAKLKWRQLRMSAGMAPRGSSPAQQERAGLNRDATFTPERGEGEKLREEGDNHVGDKASTY